MRGSEETNTPTTYHQQFPHSLYLYINIAAGVAVRIAAPIPYLGMIL